MPILALSGLVKSYATEGPPVRALRGLDLLMGRGEFAAVMGPSGSGKSTMLNLVAGLDRADAGSIRVQGLALEDMTESELARMRRAHIGFVFQQPMFLNGADVLENVEFPALVAGYSRREARERARELLDLLGLFDRHRELPIRLSGGQLQRLAIARALAHRPSLLLADEPTGALDSAGAAEILALFSRLHGDGQSILLVTHDATVAAGGDRILRMLDGRLFDEAREAASSTRVAVV